MRDLWISSVLLLELACAGSTVTTVPEPAPRLPYRGFSLGELPGPEWSVAGHEQAPDRAIVRRATSAPYHSVLVGVQFGTLAAAPVSHDHFARLARADGITDQIRYSLVSYRQQLAMRGAQWCIRYEALVRDRDPRAKGADLRTLIQGTRCQHPRSETTLIDFYYSERGLAGHLDSRHEAEAEALLESIEFEVQHPDASPRPVPGAMRCECPPRA